MEGWTPTPKPEEEDRRGVERGMPKIEAARAFGVGISSVKRYVATAGAGRSLAPKKRPGSKPKLDEAARKLWKADLRERPAATLPRPGGASSRGGFRGIPVSDSTVSRALAGLGWSRKRSVGATERDEFLRSAWRAMAL